MAHTARFGRIVSSLFAALLTTLLATQVVLAQPPASSGPVSRYTDVFAASYFDEQEGWLALGGPPPEEGCFGEGFDDPAQFMAVQTAAGPIVGIVHQAELDVFVYDITLGDPCELLFAGMTPEPLYVGTFRTVGTDNDVEVSRTRTNSFGGSSTGWVWDSEGNRCHFSAHVRLQVTRNDEFRVVSEGITISC